MFGVWEGEPLLLLKKYFLVASKSFFCCFLPLSSKSSFLTSLFEGRQDSRWKIMGGLSDNPIKYIVVFYCSMQVWLDSTEGTRCTKLNQKGDVYRGEAISLC